MSDGAKIQGVDDMVRLAHKSRTWEPPHSLDEFLVLVRTVIETSKYKDAFIKDEDSLANLRTLVKVKAARVAQHPDIEECVDVAAYAYMVFHLFLRDANMTSALGE